jgi:hypothetical protein
MMSFGSTRGIQPTRDFYRVLGLPRREWTPEDIERIRPEMDAIVRQPGGTWRLNPIQTTALFELHHNYGLFAPIGVGEGKTIISLLAPLITRSMRPLLLTPAALQDKTKRDQRRLTQHFRIPNYIRIVSYELLGRPQSQKLLEQWKPDIIVADECHKLKSRDAACTKRVARYMHANPLTRAVMMSGTVTKRSLKDFWHLLQWCLRERSPIPLSWSELEEWADVLDQRDGAEARREPGALLHLCSPEERFEGPPSGLRKAFSRRLAQTPGVIASNSDSVSCSLSLEVLPVDLPENVKEALAEMRRTWKTPNGEAFADALTMWRHCRELAHGFFYRWDPPAPSAWLEARSAWMVWCKYILDNNRRGLDSPVTVSNAVDAGHYPDALPALEGWRAIKTSFEPRSTPVWLSPFLALYVRDWIRTAPPTLVWVDQKAFGSALQVATGLPYYAAEGKDARSGRSIEDEPGGRSVILSLESNKEGRNLQDRWSRNLFVSPMPNGQRWQQALARTHRQNQPAENVENFAIVSCPEHEASLAKAIADARYMRDVMNQPQKLLMTDFVNFDPDC